MATEPHPGAADGESPGWATLVRDKDFKQLEKLSGVQGLARKIGTDVRRGLETSAVEGLRQRFGTAFIHKGKVRPFWRILLEAAKDITLLLLTVSAVITLVFAIVITHEETDIIEGCAIVAAILVVVFVSAVQNYSQERAFDSLTRYREERRVRVVRGGRETSCSVFDLVVGDIHIVESGEVLSADGLLLRGDGVQCDESAMTGESKAITKRPVLAGKHYAAMGSADGGRAEVATDAGAGASKAGQGSSPSDSGGTRPAPAAPAPAPRPIPAQADRTPTPPQQPQAGQKSDAAPPQQQPAKSGEGQRQPECFMLAGTTVTSGSGQMLVLAVGLNSNYGQIIRSLEVNKPPDTPLQQQLARLGRRLGALGVSVGLLTFGVLLGTYLVAESGSGYPGITPRILNFVVVAVALVVAVVPEGLPLAVTLALAYSMRRMMKEAILVRELPACETMGSATVIATDKTGALRDSRGAVRCACWPTLLSLYPTCCAAVRVPRGRVQPLHAGPPINCLPLPLFPPPPTLPSARCRHADREQDADSGRLGPGHPLRRRANGGRPGRRRCEGWRRTRLRVWPCYWWCRGSNTDAGAGCRRGACRPAPAGPAALSLHRPELQRLPRSRGASLEGTR